MTVPRVSRLLVTLLRPILRAWLWWRFRVSVVQDENVGALKPPLVILPNHVNFWDPFLVGLTMRYPIYYVAADGNFRSTLMRFLLPKVGGIPKAKARNDMESIRTLQALIVRRRAIVLFAEGQRNWDGVSRPVMSGTDKLVRLLGAPVLAIRLRGAYLATPRWARNLRRGPVIIEKELILTPEELRRLPRSEIEGRINAAIAVDETAWQRRSGHLYHSPRRAEHLEWAIFHCPACGTDGSIRSRGNEFFCSVCGETHWIAPSGRLYRREPVIGFTAPRLPDIHTWNDLQREVLRNRLTEAVRDRRGDILTVDRCLYSRGYRSRALRRQGHVSIRIDWDRIVIDPPGTEIPIDRISGVHVQYIEQLEFYANRRLHVFRILEPHDSAYRIERTLEELYRLTHN